MKPVKIIEYRNHKIEIWYDDFCFNLFEEREFLGTITSINNSIPGKECYKDIEDLFYNVLYSLDYDSEYIEKMLERYPLCDRENISVFENLLGEKAIYLPIYAYIHSGIALNTVGFCCPWDSGQIGYIYVSREQIKREYGKKRVSKKLRTKIEEILKNEVEIYSQYISGEVYGYRILDLRGNEIDSCFGFIGDIEKNGIIDHAKDYIDNL